MLEENQHSLATLHLPMKIAYYSLWLLLDYKQLYRNDL